MIQATWESTAWVLGRMFGPIDRDVAEEVYKALRKQGKRRPPDEYLF